MVNICCVCGYEVNGKIHVSCTLFSLGELSPREYIVSLKEEVKLKREENSRKKDATLLGKLKVWQLRLASYISMVNFIMILYLYILESPLGIQWYHWVIVIVFGIVVVMSLDILYVFPETQRYTWIKNPEYLELKQEIKDNTKKLDTILKKLKTE